MKTKLLLIFLLLSFVFYPGTAQVPQGFNYMAIARDGDGNLLPDQPLTIRIAILSQAILIWEEEHEVTTNKDGLFQLIVGDPEARPGDEGSVHSFSDIDWTEQPLYIRTRIWLKGEFQEMGSAAQLFSVPYAMVTQKVSGLNKLSVAGTTENMVEPLFEVRNYRNEIVFGVYNEGVRVGVGDGDKKGVKGGFAIGNLGTEKTGPQDYLRVYPDSTRIYVKNSAKGVKGGFAIGSFGGATKGNSGNFLDITPKNYFIGHETGTKIPLVSGGLYNSVIGYKAARNLSTGNYNTILGYLADSSLISGVNNIIIGATAGYNLTIGNNNTFIGSSAGFNFTNQEYNVMIGTCAGYNVNATGGYHGWDGSFNTFVGINAGFKIHNSKENVFLGTNAGYMLENGHSNTIVGIDAGRGGEDNPYNYLGYLTERNTFLGCQAGRNLLNGSDNVFIGYQAGSNETGSNKLYIANSSSDPPLIYGDFSTGNVGIGTTTITNKLNVGGDASVSGTLTAGQFSGNVTGSVTGNVTGNVSGSAGNIGGITMGIIHLNGSGTLLTACGGKFVLTSNGSTITVTNNSGTYCSFWWLAQQASVASSGSGVINYPPGSAIVLPAFTVNGQGMEIHFGLENGGAYCSVWVSWSNSKIFGHYTMY